MCMLEQLDLPPFSSQSDTLLKWNIKYVKTRGYYSKVHI